MCVIYDYWAAYCDSFFITNKVFLCTVFMMTSKRTSTPISDNYSQDDISSLHAEFKASLRRNHPPKRKVNSPFETRYDAGTGERMTSRKRPRKRKLETNTRQENRKYQVLY